MDEWTKCLESGGQINVMYTNFEKAFYKVSHKLLLHKLCNYNVNESVILWMESFLCSRKQRVKINGCFFFRLGQCIMWNYFMSFIVYFLY